MVYGIGRAHKLGENRKWLDNTIYTSSAPSTPSYSYYRLGGNTDSKTNVFLATCFDTSIQNQRNSDSYASSGENDVESAGLYQITNHHKDSIEMMFYLCCIVLDISSEELP